MSKDLRTPKYLREFVLSRCLGCTVRVEAIARELTKQQRGPMPAFGSKELPDYAKGSASDFKQIRRAVLDLVETKEATIPHEGFVRSAIETAESKGEYMPIQVENGKAYNVHHSRKGKFVLMVSSQCEEWISGTIVSGTARAMMDYNVKEAGEEITVRKSLLYSATEVPPC